MFHVIFLQIILNGCHTRFSGINEVLCDFVISAYDSNRGFYVPPGYRTRHSISAGFVGRVFYCLPWSNLWDSIPSAVSIYLWNAPLELFQEEQITSFVRTSSMRDHQKSSKCFLLTISVPLLVNCRTNWRFRVTIPAIQRTKITMKEQKIIKSIKCKEQKNKQKKKTIAQQSCEEVYIHINYRNRNHHSTN